MDWFNIFLSGPGTAGAIRSLTQAQQKSAEQIRAQIRRSASIQADSLDSLAQENRELRLYLTAIATLLVEKGFVTPAEIQAKVVSLLPPIPVAPPEDDSPFAGLGR